MCQRRQKTLKSSAYINFECDRSLYSSVSIWEASIKASFGKLDVDIDALTEAISMSGFLELPLNVDHITKVHRLPNLHKDPFDRILIAQAISEPLKFLTINEKLKEYSELVEVVS